MDGPAETALQSDRSRAMRGRLIAATHEIVAQRGVPAITFRSVAKTAGVSLGTVSYHFSDKTELMCAAIEWSRGRFRARCDAAWRFHREGRDLAHTLADLIEELTLRTRAELLIDYELFLAAFYQPESRALSTEWSQDLIEDLRHLAPGPRADGVAYAIEGLCLHSAKLGKSFSAAEVLPMFQMLLGQHPD